MPFSDTDTYAIFVLNRQSTKTCIVIASDAGGRFHEFETFGIDKVAGTVGQRTNEYKLFWINVLKELSMSFLGDLTFVVSPLTHCKVTSIIRTLQMFWPRNE